MPVRIEPSWLSPERFKEYVDAADGDLDVASRLYEWNAEVSAALFEIIHHFEVLLRNEIVRQLERHGQSANLPPGVPWTRGARSLDEVEGRLKQQGKAVTAGRIYAGLTFGFWRKMFIASDENEELWRHALSFVFRHSRAERAVIANYLESINQLRNRIAHHGSLIELDTRVEGQKIIRLSGWIDPAASVWIKSIERVTALSKRRPVTPPRNVVVVPAADAWPLYNESKQCAYLCQAGRSIKVVDHLAFYADQEIKPVIPTITKWYDAVDWNSANAKRLAKSADPDDQALAKIIFASKQKKWNQSVYQVFLLSAPKHPASVNLTGPITHGARGRGSAFAQGHRYLRLSELLSARDTEDLATD